MERDFRQGYIAIDFPTESSDSVAALIVRSFKLFLAAVPFLTAVTVLVYLPGKLAVLVLFSALDIAPDGVVPFLVLDFLDLFLSALVVPSVVYGLVHAFRKGKCSSVAEALRWGRRQWGKTLWNKVKVEITIMLWSLLLIIPGVIAMLKLIFADIIVAIEADATNDVLTRSRELSEGKLWRVLFVLLPALPLGALHMYLSLRLLRDSTLLMAPVDSLFAVLEQWTTVAVLLMYLGIVRPEREIAKKRRAA